MGGLPSLAAPNIITKVFGAGMVIVYIDLNVHSESEKSCRSFEKSYRHYVPKW